ncbi:LOW QUALITY PROTEIN: U3 small nucleolar ribonucleoprotein MPP10-like [Rhynchophorus ferrugineus]|uniref:LOW QUALITY PROTEIN: U3 small nucleolar ribonucleoprotein MPP10-like n=1 Tax=Rhynchophorus ferrugineus TaxID=354439 RepID=UPI003FCDC331
MSEILNNLISDFTQVTCNPASFLLSNDKLIENLKANVKYVYEFGKSEQRNKSLNSLSKLIVKGFDTEQIWQQIDLQNKDVLSKSITDISKLLVNKDKLIFKTSVRKLNQESESSEESHINVSSDNDEEDVQITESESNDSETEMQRKKPNKGSIVDDEFFKLNEMETFLNKMEQTESNDIDSGNDSDTDDEKESVDLFEGNESDNEENDGRMAKFKDYFVSKEENEKKNKRKASDLSDYEEEEQQISRFESRQNRLKNKIKDLETEAVSEKPWQLKGEISAEGRPQNSLLEEVVEFDLTSRPAPVITEQTSLQLEDIIRQRIRDKVFDSVERKEKPVESLLDYKKRLVLDQEKSKKSLAQIYEKEYLDRQAEVDPANAENEEEEPELHKDVRQMMTTLFNKLDALSNFHFTSSPAVPELKIISNLPAINMEDIAPVALSDAALLAPEEIQKKPKGDIIGDSERTKTDKNRSRRKKKLKQKIHSKLKQKKEESKKIIDGVPKKYKVKNVKSKKNLK